MARFKHDGKVDVLPEAYVHDTRLLPHQLGGDLAILFPKAIAAEELQKIWSRTIGWKSVRRSSGVPTVPRAAAEPSTHACPAVSEDRGHRRRAAAARDAARDLSLCV